VDALWLGEMAEPGSATLGPRHGPVGPIAGFLERFRRSAGVPAAVGGEAATELAPVFAALDEIEHEVAALRERSDAAAARRLHEADEEAQQIVAEARERAAAERDEALRAGLQAAEVEADAILLRAEADASAVRKTGEQRLPALVTEVLVRVLETAP